MLKTEVKGHIEDQARLLKEYKEEMVKDKTDILNEFDEKKKEMENIEIKRKEETKKLINDESLRIKENIQARNHSNWERLIVTEGTKNEDFFRKMLRTYHKKAIIFPSTN